MVQPPAFREGNEAMVNREAVNCEQVWREISNYVEGEVTPTLRAAMDAHFQVCQRCRSVLEGTRAVVRLYGDERMIEVPTGFGRRLEKRLTRDARAHGSAWSSWSTWLIPVAALALFAGGLRWANSLTADHPMQSQHAQPANNIPPDMTVVVSEGARDFHVAGCDFIHNKDKERTLTAREAIREGYVPCVRCMRKYLQTALNASPSLESEARSETDADDDEHESSLR
jgi:hypothetical protein